MYLDKRLAKKRTYYQRQLEKNKLKRIVYCITLPVNGDNTMEIYSSGELWFRHYREREMVVIGLAATRVISPRFLYVIIFKGSLNPGEVCGCLRWYWPG